MIIISNVILDLELYLKLTKINDKAFYFTIIIILN